MKRKRHELFDFMQEISSEMKFEYERISRRSKEDAGTAGDEGEENWASFLRNWLPATYPVVTKGRILGSDGNASPQVDVLVLSPNYPQHLRDKKLYFAGAVLAAFECKLTLRKRHLKKIFNTSKYIKNIEEKDAKTPYQEFNSRIIYGVLAHSHDWGKGTLEKKVFSLLENVCKEYETQELDIYELVDVICVSDAATYALGKHMHYGDGDDEEGKEMMQELETDAVLSVGYNAHWVDEGDPFGRNGTIHGTFIIYLMRKLAYFDHSIRNLTQYLKETDIEGASIGRISSCPIDIDQKLIEENFKLSGGEDNFWNEWGKEL